VLSFNFIIFFSCRSFVSQFFLIVVHAFQFGLEKRKKEAKQQQPKTTTTKKQITLVLVELHVEVVELFQLYVYILYKNS